MNYLLDTNILLLYVRDQKTRKYVEERYDPFGKENNPIISVVTIGEIKSIARRNGWGKQKIKLLEDILNNLIIADINAEDVIEMYAEVDTYSQGKLKSKPLGVSARNMGKNDLWIAATCQVTQSVLLTTDGDFDHLHEAYFEVAKVKQIMKAK